MSHELQNPKKYTVRELLGSEEAMKELLHERILAVRDDLMFVINAKNNNVADNVAKLSKRLDKRFNAVQEGQRDIVDALDLLRAELQRRWWKTAWQWAKQRLLALKNRGA